MQTPVSITRAEDFKRVAAAGRRARSDGIVVQAVPSSNSTVSRLGLSVPRATGRAVARNRLRRRLRSAWRQLALAAPYDVVVRVGPEAGSHSFQELEGHLKAALGRAGVLLTEDA